MAKFKVNNIFQITNRGQVLTGEIIEGMIGPGYVIKLNDGSILKIKSVEDVDHLKGIAESGLLLESTNENLSHLVGQVVTVESS